MHDMNQMQNERQNPKTPKPQNPRDMKKLISNFLSTLSEFRL
jgi:hypothetical protein